METGPTGLQALELIFSPALSLPSFESTFFCVMLHQEKDHLPNGLMFIPSTAEVRGLCKSIYFT